MRLDIFTDGACSGNPGPAGIGLVIKNQDKTIQEFSRFLGEATNNIAEYMAVIYGLQEALIQRADEAVIHTDSELVYNQLTGRYKVREGHIQMLVDQVAHLHSGLRSVRYVRIPRGQNNEADGLAKRAIKKGQAKVVALHPEGAGSESPGIRWCGEESPSS